jgi:RNA recognition motif-containing protein
MITKTKKIFIGGLSATSTVDDMKAYFEQFGKVPYGGVGRIAWLGPLSSGDRAVGRQ